MCANSHSIYNLTASYSDIFSSLVECRINKLSLYSHLCELSHFVSQLILILVTSTLTGTQRERSGKAMAAPFEGCQIWKMHHPFWHSSCNCVCPRCYCCHSIRNSTQEQFKLHVVIVFFCFFFNVPFFMHSMLCLLTP